MEESWDCSEYSASIFQCSDYDVHRPAFSSESTSPKNTEHLNAQNETIPKSNTQHYRRNGTIKHYEWIENDANNFPNYQFVKELKKILDQDDGNIFRYSAHENTVLQQIRNQMIQEDDSKYKELIDTKIVSNAVSGREQMRIISCKSGSLSRV